MICEPELLDKFIRLSWFSGDLSYKLHEKQFEVWERFFSSPHDEFIFFISRQFGKSFLSCCIALSYAIRHPESVVRIVAPTKDQAYDIVNDQMTKIIRDAPAGFIVPLRSDLRWRVGKSEIRLGTVARAHVDTIRGANASLIVLEEGGFSASDEYRYAYESVIVPQVTKTRGRILHVTTPSEQPEHYIHTNIIPRCKERGTFFSHTIFDNPFVDEEHIEKIAVLLGGRDSLAFRREYLCEIVRDQSTVCVPAFSDRHIVPVTYDYGDQVIVFGDFGGSRDKTVIHFSFVDRVTNKMKVVRELVYPSNTSTRAIIDGVRAMEASMNFYPIIRVFDAPSQLLIDINDVYGLSAYNVLKGDWFEGLNWLNVAFETDLIEVDPSCVFTIKTLRAATFNKQRNDYDRTEELGHMDAVASLTYGVRAHMRYSPNFRWFDAVGREFGLDRSKQARAYLEGLLTNKFSVGA